jgi:hypothetical protein
VLHRCLERDANRLAREVLFAVQNPSGDLAFGDRDVEEAAQYFKDVMDEAQGLHSAFLIARAPTVIGSLWAVSDLSTALVMKRLHENIYRRHIDKACALREAQIWLRQLPLTETQRLLSVKQTELKRLRAFDRLPMIDRAAAQLETLAANYSGKPLMHPSLVGGVSMYWIGSAGLVEGVDVEIGACSKDEIARTALLNILRAAHGSRIQSCAMKRVLPREGLGPYSYGQCV